MTDLELKEFVASLAVRQAETDRVIRETDRVLRERQLETDRLLREDRAETERLIRERQAETERLIEEIGREFRQQNREFRQQNEELGKQIGGLGQKFGGFTEGMAFPSMQKILRQQFGMDVISIRNISRKNGWGLEIDVLAYSNRDINEVYVVEVKSHLREDSLQQMLRILREFHEFFPGHEYKKVYGILAAVDIPDDVRDRVLKQGIYLARVHDDTFEIAVPDALQHHDF